MTRHRTDRSSLLALALVCLAGLVAAPAASADGILDVKHHHACVVEPDGDPVCWGWEDPASGYTQLSETPQGPLRSVTTGFYHSCTLSPLRRPVCWGQDGAWTSGADGTDPAVAVSAGFRHTCAISAVTFGPVCWGDAYAAVPEGGVGAVTSLSAGTGHTCAVRTDDSAVCWGANGLGQASVPSDLGAVSSVAAGQGHSCAVKVDGTPVCWGDDTDGKATVLAGTGAVKAIATGINHTCAVKLDDTVACWGRNTAGQATVPGDLGTVIAIDAADTFTCAVRTNGTVDCWGQNAAGPLDPPLGTGPVGPPAVVTAPSITAPAWKPGQTVTVDPGTFERQVGPLDVAWESCEDSSGDQCDWIDTDDSTDGDTTYTLTDADVGNHIRAKVTYSNWTGQTVASTEPAPPVGSPTLQSPPEITGTPETGQTLTTTNGAWLDATGHAVAWLRCPDATLESCAPISSGDATDGDTTYELTFADAGSRIRSQVTASNDAGAAQPSASEPTNVVEMPVVSGDTLEAGGGTCAVRTDGDPVCWSEYGSWTPATGSVASVSEDEYDTCFVKIDGIATCNPGLGPVASVSFKSSSDMYGSYVYGCAVKTDGTPACWGQDVAGRSVVPADIGRVRSITAGKDHTCALETRGTVRCWGWNGNGETAMPAGLGPATAISAGTRHTCAVRADGQLRCWGWNFSGQRNVPSDLGPVTSVSAGEQHTCAIKAGGDVVCWGNDDLGQASVPADLGPASAVAAGTRHTCALRTTGRVRCWGGGGQAPSDLTMGPHAPVNSTAPSLSAPRWVAGQTVTADPGTWRNSPTSYSYSWLRCPSTDEAGCAPISSPDAEDGGASYTLTGADSGQRIRATVTATNDEGVDAPVRTAASQVVGAPTLLTPPAISGKNKIGEVLTTTLGTWTANPTSYTVEWLRCTTFRSASGVSCEALTSADAVDDDTTYTPVDADEGRTLRSRVTARNGHGAGEPSTSKDTRIIGAPVLLTAPTVSGSPRAGQTLTSTTGEWAEGSEDLGIYWQRCTDATDESCEWVESEDGEDEDATYTLTGDDSGRRIRSVVFISNEVDHSEASSAFTAVVDAPISTEAPVVSGTTRTGFTLTTTYGEWTGNPTGHTVEWLRCTSTEVASCTKVATATTYKLVDADDGKRMRSRVTARNAHGDGVPSVSAPTAVIDLPVNTIAPVVSGATRTGQVLTTTRGTWTGSPSSYAVEWLRCTGTDVESCAPIESADAADGDLTYTLVDADDATRIRSRVTASNSVGAGEPKVSAATAVVDVPAIIDPPVVSGTTRTGFTLSTTNGDWTGTPTGHTVEWLRCTDATVASCTPIPGTAGQSYKLVDADDGKRIRSRVVARNANGDGAPSTSAATAVIDLPFNTVVPVVSGSTRTGQVLTTNRGTWTGTPSSYLIEWLRCTGTDAASCTKIATTDATDGDLTYTLVDADDAKRIRSRVTATNGAGTGVPVSSTPTAIVDIPTVLSAPVVSGTTRTGFTLTSTNGEWTGAPTGFTVEWLRCTDTTVASCARITAAASYKLVDADDGKRIRSRVTARNAGGDGSPSTSLATAVIDLPMNTVLPAVSGSARSGQVLTTNRGTWTGSPSSYAIEWLACTTTDAASCVKLTSTDATNNDLTYTAIAGDAGKRIRSRVAASNAFGAGVPASSNPTAAVDAPTNTVLPTVSGRTRTGDTLTATTGDWTGTPTSYTIEWLRCADTLSSSCAPITGTDATDNNTTYKLVNADDAKRIRVRVVATNANGVSAPATSIATGVIDLPAATFAPVVSGTAAIGQTLTTTRGTWTGLPTGYTIEWLKCTTTSVSSCTKLTTADATNNDLTYTATAGEAGAYLRSRVTASNAGGAGTPSTSAATAAVS